MAHALMAVLALFAGGDEWLKGRVEQVGTVYTPGLNLITEDGKRYEIATGELSTELAGLEGAKLELQVQREKGGSMLPRLKAVAYKIADIGGGDKPEVGVVKVDGESVSIIVDSQKHLKLADTQVARNLRTKAGHKVWVVGKVNSSGAFKVWRVGFLGAPRTVNAAAPASLPAASQPTDKN